MIVVFSENYDPCTNAVVKRLSASKRPWVRLNGEDFGRTFFVSVCISDKGSSFRITHADGVINSDEVTCIWFRRQGVPQLPESFSSDESNFAMNEIFSLIAGLAVVTGPRWINYPPFEKLMNSKSAQLALAASLGMLLPPTLMSNSVDEVLDFRSNNGTVLFKTIAGSRRIPIREHSNKATASDITREIIFANILSEEHIKYLHSIRLAPVQFQAYVEKAYNVRVTYVDSEIFACRIFSQDRDDTRIDFRRMVISGEIRHEPID